MNLFENSWRVGDGVYSIHTPIGIRWVKDRCGANITDLLGKDVVNPDALRFLIVTPPNRMIEITQFRNNLGLGKSDSLFLRR